MAEIKRRTLGSPIRWAGSKKRIVNQLFNYFPNDKEYYIEPFLGSGTVLLNILDRKEDFGFKKYYVNDANDNIINFYKSLKENNSKTVSSIKRIVNKYNSLKNESEKESMYYEIREKYNSNSINENTKNIYFYFLMKTGFNGVYRVNSNGKFNVPFGRKNAIPCNYDCLKNIEKEIKNVEFYSEDYKQFLDNANKKGILNKSFIYFDPPYLPEDESVYQTQMLYSIDEFNHVEFANILEKLNKEKAKYIVSMSASKNANNIYNKECFKRIEIDTLTRTVNPIKGFKSVEIIYTNI